MQQVGLRIQQNGALELVRPVVVVRQTAQAGLDAADQDGNFRMCPADEVAVDHRGVVRSFAGHAAGGVGVGLTAVLAHGVMVDHGGHISARDEKAEARRAEDVDGVFLLPVRLGYDGDLVARGLQHAADDRVAEGGVIDVGVADHIDKVRLFPAKRAHLLRADRQKAAAHFVPVEPKPPSPRTVSDRVSDSTNRAVRNGVRIICAMRSPGSIVCGAALSLRRGTKNSPR